MDEIFLEDEATGLLVSNLGRVVSRVGNILKPSVNSSGIAYIHYSECNVNIAVHRLVARNFMTNSLNGIKIHHRDGNALNLSVGNLILKNGWSTKAKEITLCDRNGKIIRFASVNDAAKQFGVSSGSVSRVASGRRYSAGGFSIPGREKYHSPYVTISFEKDGKTLHFESMAMAARHFGVTKQQVFNLKAGKCKTVKGWGLVSFRKGAPLYPDGERRRG